MDYWVLSKFYRNCALAEHDVGEGSPAFDIWFKGNLLYYDKNYDGSSLSMEVEAVEILWKRSIADKSYYSTIVSDGDSKDFANLKTVNVYGDGIEIKKEECMTCFQNTWHCPSKPN